MIMHVHVNKAPGAAAFIGATSFLTISIWRPWLLSAGTAQATNLKKKNEVGMFLCHIFGVM